MKGINPLTLVTNVTIATIHLYRRGEDALIEGLIRPLVSSVVIS